MILTIIYLLAIIIVIAVGVGFILYKGDSAGDDIYNDHLKPQG